LFPGLTMLPNDWANMFLFLIIGKENPDNRRLLVKIPIGVVRNCLNQLFGIYEGRWASCAYYLRGLYNIKAETFMVATAFNLRSL